MAKHALRLSWAGLARGGWAGRLRVATAAAALLALGTGGAVWMFGGEPEPVSLPLRPPPTIVLSPPYNTTGVAASASPARRPASPSQATAPDTDGRPPPDTAQQPAVTPRRSRQPARSTAPTSPAPVPADGSQPARAAMLSSQYITGSSSESGFVAVVVVRNTTRATARFQVRLSFPAQFQVRIRAAWNATTVSGTGTIVLAGGPLPPGSETGVGFEATKALPSSVNPTSCTVVVVSG